MSQRKRYRRKSGAEVTAVRLDLETEGFSYFKWGAWQQCKADDWIVCNQGDVYTVSADTFAATYTEVSPGRYRKTGEVWAEVAETDGSVTTREGKTHYRAGDYLVCNIHDDTDCYAISRERFLDLYEPV